jgi:hypothetical protein
LTTRGMMEQPEGTLGGVDEFDQAKACGEAYD